MNEQPNTDRPGDMAASAPKLPWRTPTVNVVEMPDAEAGFIDPAPEGPFGLS